MPRRRRTPLPLHPRGSFLFTERTVSVDVSRVYHPTGANVGTTILHVGRSRGALEFPKSGRPAIEVDAATVLLLWDMENVRRRSARGLSADDRKPVELDPGVLSNLKTVAKRQAKPSLPFEGRPRQCWGTSGAHPHESLWLATDTGETVIETRSPNLDCRGDVFSYATSTRPVSASDALEWLRVEGAFAFPSILCRVAGKTVDEVMNGPAEPFRLSADSPSRKPGRKP